MPRGSTNSCDHFGHLQADHFGRLHRDHFGYLHADHLAHPVTLTADEKAVADRGRNQPGWDAINDAYGQAAMERAEQAAAEAAANQLGAEHLDIGVVP